MFRCFFCILPFLILALLLPGCRRAAPPSFTPSPEVVSLLDDLEDEEEIKIYRGLQLEIADTLEALTGTPDKPILLGTDESNNQLKHGYYLYSQHCVQCHGVNGDGNGPVAEHLNPRPRNYTQGVFKFTSTPYGSKPRRADLARTIRVGVTGTSMPSFDRFSQEEIDAVVEYVLALTYRGELERQLASYAYEDEELPGEEDLEDIVAEILEPWEDSSGEIVMPVTVMPPMTDESVRIGHQIFLNKACNKCHGKYGRGGSMGNVEVGKDAWGYEAAAADLSSGMFHGGNRPIDIYRRIYSGINGTPMPAFAQTFADNPDDIWHLVHFIKATGNRRRQGKPPLSAADLPTEAPAEKTQPETDETAPTDEDSDETSADAEPAETESETTETNEAEEEETETEEALQPAA